MKRSIEYYISQIIISSSYFWLMCQASTDSANSGTSETETPCLRILRLRNTFNTPTKRTDMELSSYETLPKNVWLKYETYIARFNPKAAFVLPMPKLSNIDRTSPKSICFLDEKTGKLDLAKKLCRQLAKIYGETSLNIEIIERGSQDELDCVDIKVQGRNSADFFETAAAVCNYHARVRDTGKIATTAFYIFDGPENHYFVAFFPYNPGCEENSLSRKRLIDYFFVEAKGNSKDVVISQTAIQQSRRVSKIKKQLYKDALARYEYSHRKSVSKRNVTRKFPYVESTPSSRKIPNNESKVLEKQTLDRLRFFNDLKRTNTENFLRITNGTSYDAIEGTNDLSRDTSKTLKIPKYSNGKTKATPNANLIDLEFDTSSQNDKGLQSTNNNYTLSVRRTNNPPPNIPKSPKIPKSSNGKPKVAPFVNLMDMEFNAPTSQSLESANNLEAPPDISKSMKIPKYSNGRGNTTPDMESVGLEFHTPRTRWGSLESVESFFSESPTTPGSLIDFSPTSSRSYFKEGSTPKSVLKSSKIFSNTNYTSNGLPPNLPKIQTNDSRKKNSVESSKMSERKLIKNNQSSSKNIPIS